MRGKLGYRIYAKTIGPALCPFQGCVPRLRPEPQPSPTHHGLADRLPYRRYRLSRAFCIVSYRRSGRPQHIVSHRIASPRIRIGSYRIVPPLLHIYRIVSYRLCMYRILSYRFLSYRNVSLGAGEPQQGTMTGANLVPPHLHGALGPHQIF